MTWDEEDVRDAIVLIDRYRNLARWLIVLVSAIIALLLVVIIVLTRSDESRAPSYQATGAKIIPDGNFWCSYSDGVIKAVWPQSSLNGCDWDTFDALRAMNPRHYDSGGRATIVPPSEIRGKIIDSPKHEDTVDARGPRGERLKLERCPTHREGEPWRTDCLSP